VKQKITINLTWKEVFEIVLARKIVIELLDLPEEMTAEYLSPTQQERAE
jgi:hypothetical protein